MFGIYVNVIFMIIVCSVMNVDSGLFGFFGIL